MCGIAGIISFKETAPPTMAQLTAMCDTIFHRGPDEDGLEIRDKVAFGMRRLAIIDLSGGRQPIYNENKTIRTVFNGEIYNFRELKQDLEKKGHVFRTKVDTEVIVHAYEEYGTAFPEYLNGMFAIALHDIPNHKVIFARDHIGIKPFYYSFNNKHFIFGSEIKVLLASNLIHRELDIDALGQFLAWEYVPGEQTLFTSIRKLKAGELIEIDLDNPSCTPRPFWDIPLEEDTSLSESEWLEAVDAKIKQCVQRQLISDVPLGAFLSGGVDSSLMVAAMGRAKTFSIGFDDPTYNELPWAREVASHLGVDHLDEIIKPDIQGLFEQLLYYMDDPIGDFSIFPTYLVSKVARKHVTVALGGDGGDEIFGGYETYLANEKACQYLKLPFFLRQNVIEPLLRSIPPRPAKKGLINKAKRFLEGLDETPHLSHARWRVFAGTALREQLFTGSALNKMVTPVEAHITDLFQKAEKREPLNQCLYVDLKSYLCDNILVKVDRMSMAVSLEARVPYLDKELVELAFRIPDSFKVNAGQTKILLKKVAAKYVPSRCIYRKKEGFSIPIKNWLKAELKAVTEDLLDNRKLQKEAIFNPRMVERLKQEHYANRANHSHVLWALIMFQAWRQKWQV